MPTTSADVPAWPAYKLTMHEDGGVLTSGPLMAARRHTTRAAAIATVAVAADRLGRPVRATATEQDGTVWHLIISPGGEVDEASHKGPRATTTKKRRERRPANAPTEKRTAPGSRAPTNQPGGHMGPGTYTESLAQIREHLEAGRISQASTLAGRLDEQAASDLGISHPDALSIREVRARVTALAGDAVGSIRLYRDVAERWHYRGDDERAEAVASRAQSVWLQITHLDQAVSAGVAVVRMRSQIPGRGGDGITAVLEHRERLLKARNANLPQRWERSLADSPPPRGSRPALTWERPAVGTRTAG
ncbi:hypothetical protein [Streptomyces sp. NRRL S-813]|uniref:hypothetical protein n=1 Tax=Streptomyces sp. NRRL S-813 TaxID=1463919 RepID=UPI0004BFE5C0|nr:hypothetical protein [Streptomyces sp. NRRL S-813]